MPNNYKTKRCRHFDAGRCRLGGLCNFAHGDEELRQFKAQDSIRTELLSPINQLPKLTLQNSSSKIKFMEKCLENFYHSQKHMLEQLKFLTLNLNSTITAHSDDQVSQIENNVIKIYNESVSYAHAINKVMDIGIEENKEPFESTITKRNSLSDPVSYCGREAKERSNSISELLDHEENGLIAMKAQMTYIYERLCEIYRHPSSKTIGAFESSLKKAAEALRNNKVIEAAQWLQSILYDASLDQQSKRRHSKIIEDARSL